MRIFDLTNRPDPNLFFSSYDPNDPRLGSIVKYKREDYGNCRFVLLGCPQDKGVERNRGRLGAADGPDMVRKVLYKMAHTRELETVGFFDLGNLKVDGKLEKIHQFQFEVVKGILGDGKFPIIIGGGNDISYPDCKAVGEFYEYYLSAINIDNHFDVRENSERNSGTPYRMLLEENILAPKYFVEIGCQFAANSYIYKDYLDEKGVDVFYLDQVLKEGVHEILERILSSFEDRAVFWGYDLDSIKAADAPGVSAITPVGLSAEDAIKIAQMAGSHPFSVLFEITEFNPKYDIDNRTARLASLMIINFLTSHILTRKY